MVDMIVVTTPTGDIGSQVLAMLLDRAEEPVRVVVRDPARLPATTAERVEVLAGSHGDPNLVHRAFTDADAVFWVAPPDRSTPSLDAIYTDFARPAAAAFAACGVGHVVGVSALGRGTPVAAEAGLVTASLAMDDLIVASGVAYRALANPSFMDNVLRQVASLREDGVYRDTAQPDRAAPLAATRDIAATAVELLCDRSWTGTGEVAVLGPQDLSADDMVATMADVLERPVGYEQQSFDDLGATMRRYGASDAFADGMVDMMRAKNNGLDAGVRRTPENTTITSFRQWCHEVLRPAVLASQR